MKTPDEISALVAEKVAGLTVRKEWHGYNAFKDGKEVAFLHYATSADAVLPLLEKEFGRYALNDLNLTYTGDNWYIDGAIGDLSRAPTFPLAACIALLRSKGVEV